jgi:hypothetical protein
MPVNRNGGHKFRPRRNVEAFIDVAMGGSGLSA